MKHQIAILLFLFGLLPLTTLRAEVKDTLGPQPKQINVACWKEFYPFIYKDANGAQSGVFIDIWNLWSMKTGIPVRFLFYNTWEGALNATNNGVADAHSGLMQNRKRENHLDFLPDFRFPSVINIFYTTDANLDLESAEGQSQKVGIIGGTFQHDYFVHRYPNRKIRTYTKMIKMLQDLMAGKLDLIIGEGINTMHIINKSGYHGRIHRIDIPLLESDYLVAVSRRRPQSKAWIRYGFQQISRAELLEIERTNIPKPNLRTLSQSEGHINLTEQEKHWLFRHPKIRIGYDPAWAPFEFTNEKGEHSGLSADMIDLIQQKLNLHFVEISGKSWHETMEMARRKEVDILPFIAPTPERAPFLNFTQALYLTQGAIVTKTSHPFTQIAALEGKTIALVKDYAITEEVMRTLGHKIHPVFVETTEEGLSLVANSKADAMISVKNTLNFLLVKRKYRQLHISAAYPLFSEMCIGVRKDWPELTQILNKVLNSIATPNKQAVIDRWENLQVKEELNIGLLLLIIIPLILIIVVISFLLNRTNREIKQRKITEKALKEAIKQEEAARQSLDNFWRLVSQKMLSAFAIGQIESDGPFSEANNIRFIEINPEFARITGIQESQIRNKTFRQLLPDAGDQLINDVLKEVEQHGTYKKYIYLEALKKHLDFMAFHIDDERLAIYFHDRTDQEQTNRHLLASEEKFRHLAENPLVGTFIFQNNRFCYINPTLGQLLGYKPAEILRKYTLAQLVHPDDLAPLLQIFTNLYDRNDSKVRIPSIRLRGNQREIIADHYVFLGQYMEKPAIYGLVLDITRQVRIQSELEKAKARAEESDQLKTNFLANMSHEIRTPMNAILGFSKLLEDRDLDADNRQQYIGHIVNNGQNMLNLINDIIDLAKVESNEMVLQADALRIYTTLHTLHNDFEKRNVNPEVKLLLNVSPSCMKSVIQTDPFRFRQVVTNLLVNALNYTQKGSVELGAFLSGQMLVIYVKDSGRGISKEQKAVIFERFQRGKLASNDLFSGAGLGLAISQKLAQLMGGDLSVESEEGRGSTFYFKLPFVQHQTTSVPEPSQPGTPPIHNWTGIKILVVEDVESNYLFVESVLQKTHARILWATDSTEALKLFDENPTIDLVLTDIQLPGMDGYQLTGMLKQIRPRVPVISVTAYAMDGDREKSLAAQCDDYLTKPLNKDLLLERIGYWLQKDKPA